MTGIDIPAAAQRTDMLTWPLATLLALLTALPATARPQVALTVHGVMVCWQRTPQHTSPWVVMTYLTVSEATDAVLAARPPAVRAAWADTFSIPDLAGLRCASAMRQLLGRWAAVEVREGEVYQRLITGPCSVERRPIPALRLPRSHSAIQTLPG